MFSTISAAFQQQMFIEIQIQLLLDYVYRVTLKVKSRIPGLKEFRVN